MKVKKKKNRKIKIILKSLKKTLKLRNVVVLIVILVANTFAWFVFSGKVQNDIDAHVRAWKVSLSSEGEEISSYFVMDSQEIYPGMPTATKTLDILNEGEVSANVRFEILEARIFDTTYISEEGRQDRGETSQSGDMTSEELADFLGNNFPFKIEFILGDEVLEPETGTTDYTISISWPFESGNDTEDTYWGNEAYYFTHPEGNETNTSSVSCISIVAKVYIEQVNS